MKRPSKRKPRRNQAMPEPPPRAADAAPFAPDEFFFAMTLASAVYSLRMPTESHLNRRIEILDDDTKTVTEVQFTDVPLNRMGFALAEHFEDASKFASFMYRHRALGQIRNDTRMSKFVLDDPDSDQIGIHSAVLEAAATLNLRPDGTFEPERFFALVEEIVAAGKYDEPPDDNQ